MDSQHYDDLGLAISQDQNIKRHPLGTIKMMKAKSKAVIHAKQNSNLIANLWKLLIS